MIRTKRSIFGKTRLALGFEPCYWSALYMRCLKMLTKARMRSVGHRHVYVHRMLTIGPCYMLGSPNIKDRRTNNRSNAD